MTLIKSSPFSSCQNTSINRKLSITKASIREAKVLVRTFYFCMRVHGKKCLCSFTTFNVGRLLPTFNVGKLDNNIFSLNSSAHNLVNNLVGSIEEFSYYTVDQTFD